MSADLARVRVALLFGNFVIGCGVMVVPGTLNDLSRSLAVSPALAGQLISIGAAVMALAAPTLAGWVSGFDRRRLLVLSLLWYGAGHLACAAMADYAALWPARALTMLAAAVFTPQAAAAVGFMASPQERGRAITVIFLGWSMASVLGMPLSAWIGESFGWRSAFATVAALAIVAALWVHRVVPDGVRPAALSLRAWLGVFGHPVLMAIVLVTALQSAGQFTLFSYFAPYYRQVLHASPGQTSAMFFWFGAFGLIGNVLLTRHIDRLGAERCVAITLVLITVALVAWPLGTSLVSMAVLLVPWALGCFSCNSAQQARLGHAAPALAPALMALNTSAIYLGQAVGAAGGGALLARSGFDGLNWVGVAWLLVAIALSSWAARKLKPVPA